MAPTADVAVVPPGPTLIEVLRDRLRALHYSPRTAEVYIAWVRRYVRFHDRRHPRELGVVALRNFLTHLARDRRVSASTQNQALAAIRQPRGLIGQELRQLFECTLRISYRAHFDPVPQQHHGHKGGQFPPKCVCLYAAEGHDPGEDKRHRYG
jgi:hypothetical protein